jgi:hypothetical protein
MTNLPATKIEEPKYNFGGEMSLANFTERTTSDTVAQRTISAGRLSTPARAASPSRVVPRSRTSTLPPKSTASPRPSASTPPPASPH